MGVVKPLGLNWVGTDWGTMACTASVNGGGEGRIAASLNGKGVRAEMRRVELGVKGRRGAGLGEGGGKAGEPQSWWQVQVRRRVSRVRSARVG